MTSRRRPALILIPLLTTLGLAACGGDEAETLSVCNPLNIDTNEDGTVTTATWTDDERKAMVAACEAGKELQGEDMQPLLDALRNDFFFEDYDEAVCPAFSAAADAIDRMGFLATNANNTITYITGEAVRWDQLSALKVECGDEIFAWQQATAKHQD